MNGPAKIVDEPTDAAAHGTPSSRRLGSVLSAAIVRAGLDPAGTLDAMRAGTGALFIDGERHRGALEPEAVSAALGGHPDGAAERCRTTPGPEGPAGVRLDAERPSRPGDRR